MKLVAHSWYKFVICAFTLPCTDLLEKSRVILQQPGERCYHIFYQILAGADDKVLGDLLLSRQVKSYNFLANGEVSVDNVNDAEELKVTSVCIVHLSFFL